MLTLRTLLIALASCVLILHVLADDPGFCNNVAVCTPCNCNAGGKCAGFCHTDKGTGVKHCDLQAMGCKCPPSMKLHRRGGCMSVGHRGGGGGPKVGAEPVGSCGQAPHYCRWFADAGVCADIRGRPPASTTPAKKGPTKKAPA
ncbi:hypothetical protein CTRI78_v006674 [Colletotrichum trifolii]|uniref:Secreted protein n=1 Tax=Colletotrichum trifolii TaxID=5466 RepID=A0A4R8RIK5_COLTR|nr:hypothetical protein CTRI78_v006674 [Colletotrichum trifolii]